MKQKATQTRSRWLLACLLSLLMTLGGSSPAWAQATTEEFSGDSWAEGWALGGSATSSDYYLETDADFYTSPTPKRGVYGQVSSGTAKYIITPVVNGSGSFQFKRRNSSNGSVYVYTIDNGVLSNSPIASNTSKPTSWTTVNFSNVENKKLAIVLNGRMDKFTYTPGTEGPVGIGVYTDEDCTASVKDGVNLSYGLVASAQSQTYYIKNVSGEDWTNLAISHSGNAVVTSVASTLENDAKTSFTVSMAASGSTCDVITITAGEDLSFTINVSGTVKEVGKMDYDFSVEPANWILGSNWSVANGVASVGYTSDYMYSPQIKSTGENIYFKYKKTNSSSWNGRLAVSWATTGNDAGADWTEVADLGSQMVYNEWKNAEVTIPADAKFIRIYGQYVDIDDFYGLEESSAPILSLSQTSYDFGLIDENTTSSTITITNSGPSELTGMNLVSSNAAFTFNVTDNAATIAADGGTATFTVTMSSANAGAQNGTITIQSDNADDLVLNVSGAVMKAGTTTAVFNDATLAGWTKSGNTSFNEGETAAYFYYSDTNYLTSPKVTIVADDFLAINAKLSQSYGYVTVQGSIDGSSWTDIKKLDSGELNQADYTTAIVSGISTDFKYLRLNGYYCYVKQVAGLTYAPVLVVKDAEEATQTTGLTYPFGEISANQTVSYTFTNAGAGTINITNVESSNAKFTTNFDSENKPAVTSAAPFTLTITANYDAESAGEQNGAITVTTSEGDFVINLTSTFMAANAPTLTVDNTLEFGKLTANDTQIVTVTNSGTGSMTVDIVSDNALFTVSPAELTEIGAGASKTFDVTFHYDQVTAGNYGVKNAHITVTPTYNAEAAIVINASAKAKDPEEWSENFAGNALPDGWEVSATGSFTVANGIVSGHYSTSGTLTTPSLKIGSTADAMSFKYKRNNAAIDIKKQINGGTWTQLVRLPNSSYATDDEWQTYTITGLEAGNYKFQFTNDDYDLDDFEGFKLNTDAPAFGYYTNSQCTAAAAATVTRNYGFVTEAPEAVVYYMKNDGTGTLNLTLGDVPTGFTAALGNASLAAGESTTLTINMPIAIKGYRGGDIVVTGKDSGDNTLGTFTVTASGVVIDEDKLYLDFTQNSTELPAAWTNKWEKNNAGYPRAGYSKETMETTKLVAEANEKIVIVAKNESNGYVFGLNYKAVGDENWTELIAEQNIGTDWNMLTATIPAAGNYLLQFVGSAAQIQRIYGLATPLEPVMVVYDGENVAGATKNFGMVSDEADAVWTLTVKNEGLAKLEGLAAALSGEQAAHYSAVITGATGAGNDEIEAGAQATITVEQLKDNLGAHEATLTISATGLDSKVITLSGSTRDHTLLYVDFDGTNDWPSAVASHGANWEVYAGYARQNSTTASSIVLAPLTISNASDALRFNVSRVDTNRDLTVRYTTNGGVTWNDYNFGTNETPVTSLKEQITSTSSYNDFEITNIPAGTVAFDFYGKSIKLDNINADYSLATAPLVAFTKVTDNISDANLTADAEATYTLANIGNANYVGTVAKANVNVAISGEGVTYEGNTLTIPAGKTAEITVTMPFTAPYGAKNGSMTITSESWVGDVAVNYTANLIDPDAINIDFASAPAGWYNAGWAVDGSAHIFSGLEQELISEQFAAEEGKNVLSFKAKAQSGNEGTLKVYTSTDRKAWSEPTEFTLTGEYATKSLEALADGNSYYVKFVSLNANIDDLTGLKKVTGIEHDLYVFASNIPAETKVPETSITATATVYSLRAAETGVYAKLFFDETVVATADAQDISLNGSKTFELTGNVPAAEKTYAAKIVVYYNNNSVAFETATTDVEVQHTRTLAIASFTRTDGDGALDADVNNQVSPAFSVTVQNTGTTAGTPTVKIYQGENVVATATAAAEVAAGATSDAIALTATNMSAGEGGEMAFTAKAFWTAEDPEAKATSASDIVITINAAAPKFALYDSEDAPVANETAYDYGLTRTKIDKVFTIKNEGTKTLQLTSVVAPTGFTATAVTNENKNIAVNGELAINVSLDPSEGLGKKNGNVVITYDVNGTPATFTLAVSGRSIAENTWVEQFDEGIPATWQNTGWTVENGQAYSGGYNEERTLMTPRLAAADNEELTFDATFRYTGYTLTVEYSTDKTSWNSVVTINDENAGEQTFTAPAAGNYYLRFTGTRYAQLDNFIGFALNIPEHDMELAASYVPTTGKCLNNYVATVTLKENAGKNENITAELWVAGAKVNATADVESVEANSNATVVTLTWEPQTTRAAVDAYVKVTYDGGTLQTTPVTLTIAEVYTLSENSSDAVEAVTNETVMLQRTFAAGWNTVCLPFAVADNTAIEALFGAGTKVFNFKNYANSMIDFEAVTSMTATTPYLIYVPAAVTEPIRVNNVTITGVNTTAGTVWQNSITFQGSYAPVAAGGLTGKYGVTTTNQLAKGNDKTTMKGFRAYFEGNLANARILIFDEATGISHVYQAADLFGDDDRVYNMKGQQVENAKKGVYIVNGKKVVIK